MLQYQLDTWHTLCGEVRYNSVFTLQIVFTDKEKKNLPTLKCNLKEKGIKKQNAFYFFNLERHIKSWINT